MNTVWIVDDDQAIRWVLEKSLMRAGIESRSFSEAASVLKALAEQPDHDYPGALISDIRMPGESGLNLLERLKQQYPDLPVIIMTAYTDLDSTVAAFQGGAFDYLAKPFDVNEAVALIRRALNEAALNHQDAEESSGSGGNAESSDAGNVSGTFLLGKAPAMQEVFRAIGRLAPSRASVLITGESGTGKELVARALHGHGARSGRPFIALNTAAIPRDLLEAELFGHERGAFTGANSLRRGRFEEADGGTLFLDEIGDMPLELQTRLLRVLSEGSFYRIGGTQPVQVDVRIVAATHQPLETRVAEGKFREDLFHRLNVIRLRLPPLRERAEDIPELTAHFLAISARTLGVPVRQLSQAAMEALCAYPFPGNVRQLENFCHWLTVMAPGQIVEVHDLPPEVRSSLPMLSTQVDNPGPLQVGGIQAGRADMVREAIRSVNGLPDWHEMVTQEARTRLQRGEPAVMQSMTREFERLVLAAGLEHCRNRRVEAASRLGLGRNTITRKLRELDME